MATKEVRETIDALDFKLIIEKMYRLGWKKKHALQAIQQYKNILFLWKKYGNHAALPPSEDIDEIWHLHILDTARYQKDCESIFGKFLHHYPYFGFDQKTTINDLNLAFETTKALYLKEFGEPLYCIRINSRYLILLLLKKFLRYFCFIRKRKPALQK